MESSPTPALEINTWKLIADQIFLTVQVIAAI